MTDGACNRCSRSCAASSACGVLNHCLVARPWSTNSPVICKQAKNNTTRVTACARFGRTTGGASIIAAHAAAPPLVRAGIHSLPSSTTTIACYVSVMQYTSRLRSNPRATPRSSDFGRTTGGDSICCSRSYATSSARGIIFLAVTIQSHAQYTTSIK